MASNLDKRRRAIADALRAAMTEPLSAPKRALPSLRDSLTAHIDWDEVDEIPLEDDEAAESPPIPPLEIANAMSPTAAQALFGHD
jgi:hypothetical protein